MYVWYRALSEGPIISKAMRTTLTTAYVTRDDGIKHGYGWFIRERADGQVEQVSHTGSDGVFLSVFVWRPVDRSFFLSGDEQPRQSRSRSGENDFGNCE